MFYLYKLPKIRLGNKNLLLFFARINISILCSFLIVPNFVEAADKSFSIKDTLGINRIYVYTSLYTQHTSPDEEHVNDTDMLGVELRMNDKWLYGFTKFINSFGQESEYLYTGYKWSILQSTRYRENHQYFKLTGGLLHGYKDEYEDEIPFNGLGVAPAVVPTYGFQMKSFISEISLGGAAVVLVTFGYVF